MKRLGLEILIYYAGAAWLRIAEGRGVSIGPWTFILWACCFCLLGHLLSRWALPDAPSKKRSREDE